MTDSWASTNPRVARSRMAATGTRGDSGCLQRDRQLRVRGDQVRRLAYRGAEQVYGPDSAQQRFEHQPDFQSRQGCAQAEVPASGEREVRVRIPIDPERVRIGEDLLIAIGRRYPDAQQVTGVQVGAG